jgi:hypothetical protein
LADELAEGVVLTHDELLAERGPRLRTIGSMYHKRRGGGKDAATAAGTFEYVR